MILTVNLTKDIITWEIEFWSCVWSKVSTDVGISMFLLDWNWLYKWWTSWDVAAHYSWLWVWCNQLLGSLMYCNMELWAKQTFSSEVISFRIFHSNKTKNTGDTMGNNSEEMSYIFKCKRGSWMDAKYCSLCYLISSNSLLTLKPKNESRCEQL